MNNGHVNLLLDYYKQMNTISEWYTNHSSASKKIVMYALNGTNGRALDSIFKVYYKMLEVEGLDRSEWPKKTDTTNQEIHKQYTARAIETKLYFQTEDRKFYRTKKGMSYDKLYRNDFDDEDKYFINYVYCLDSFIENKTNYIINRTLEIKEILSNTLPIKYINDAVMMFINNFPLIKTYDDLVKYDYFYINSMYDDKEFLELFLNASNEDKKELADYLIENKKILEENKKLEKQKIQPTKPNPKCCLSKKFISGGSYTINTIKDDARIYGLTIRINGIKYTDYLETIIKMVNETQGILNIDRDVVIKYLEDERNIIEPVLQNIFGIEDAYEETVSVIMNGPDLDRPEERIDDTTIEGKRYLNSIFNSRKKTARIKANYKCELGTYKGCSYFTSKQTKKNYVEVHHLIPQEFRNNFSHSIDVLSNYITLCPHCHKMIHLAVDRERIDAVKYIYSQRKERLDKCGISVKLDELLDYYDITDR